MSRILIVASAPRSLLNFRGHLIDALLGKGFEVHVAAPGLTSGPYAHRLEAKGCVVHDIPLERAGLNPFSDWKAFVSLCRVMRVVSPTHVLAYTIKPVIYGLIAAFFAGVPNRFALITGLGYTFSEGSGWLRRFINRCSRRLYKLALMSAKKVFFQNADDERLFRSLGIVPQRTPSVVVNGSGVDLCEFSPVDLPDRPVFLLIARLVGSKGVREYAQAAIKIMASSKSARCLIVGWIDDVPDAIGQDELSSWKEQGITYLGKLEDVKPAIAQSMVYVLPSYREGTPRTVLEAMAMARPIITTDAPGCRETVVEGVNGFLVRPRSVSDIVDAMSKFVDCPDLASRMGAESRRLAEEKYDVHKVNSIMLDCMGIL